jgi:amino acid adenylation domain-containing protein
MKGGSKRGKTTDSVAALSIRNILENRAEQNPEATALLALERNPLTYARLLDHLTYIHQVLRNVGVASTDRVALALPNGPEMAVAFLGVAASCACAPLNPNYQAEEFRFYLSDLGAKVLIVQADMQTWARQVAKELGILILELQPFIGAGAGSFTFSQGEKSRGSAHDLADPNDLALVLHTSGTTSRPKVVPLTQANLCTSAENVKESLRLTASDRCLNIMPLFHVHGLVAGLMASLAAGAGVICPPAFLLPRFFEWMAEFKPTWYTAVPSMHQAILDRTPDNQEIIASNPLRFIRSCSAPLPTTVMAELEIMFRAPVLEAYGMTEASHQICCNPLPPGRPKPGSVGVPTGCRAAVMDEQGNLLPPGQAAEIVIQGSNVTVGYENNPEANQKAFINGWFRTGDQGYLDIEGYVFLTGRVKEIINRGGEKISPREVDEVLLSHPAIAQAVTFGVPHLRLGEEVAAAVVARPGALVGERELRRFAAERLAYFKVPRRVMFLDTLPKGPTGKVQRIGLAEKLGLGPEDLEPSYLSGGHIPPRNELEKQLASMWSRQLDVEEVGVEDNFFLTGGDSILAAQLISRVRQTMGVEVSLSCFFENPTVAWLASAVEEARSQLEGSSLPPLKPVPGKKEQPLSYAQERIWFFHQADPLNPVYNRLTALRLKGRLDLAILEKSLGKILERHEVLRARFISREGKPVQTIALYQPLQVKLTDLSGLPPTEIEQEAQRRTHQEVIHHFDLEHGPLFRAVLLRLAADHHVLLLNAHHIVFDAWSETVLLKELDALSRAFSSGDTPDLPDLAVQYADFADWQRNWLEERGFKDQLIWWKKQLEGISPHLELPTRHPRPPKSSFRGGRIDLVLHEPLTRALKGLGAQAGCTMFMNLLANYGLLLFRYTGQEQLIIGMPVTDRHHVAVENLIGCFINTLVLPLDFSGHPSFRGLLKRVRGLTIAAYANQELPFDKLVEELKPRRHPSLQPLCQVFFNFRNIPGQPLELAGLRIERFQPSTQVVQFDLSLEVAEQGECLALSFIYNADLFNREFIRGMAGHFKKLLEGAVAEPDRPVSKLPMLTEAERRSMLINWNNTAADFPKHTCIHQLFEVQAKRRPGAAAVIFEGLRLTYGELNQRANQLAHYLRHLGVGPEDLVGIHVERSLEMVVSILAVLKAGGAYVALDPEYPQERIAYMLQESRPEVLLTMKQPVGSLLEMQARVVQLDEDLPRIAAFPISNPEPRAGPENLAYVLYTSGSTGKPKGVMITHRSLVNHMTWMQRYFSVTDKDRVLLNAPISFDASVCETFLPLMSGGRLVVTLSGGHRDPMYLIHTMEQEDITIAVFVPTLLSQIVQKERFSKLTSLVHAISVGEILSPELMEKFLSVSRTRLHNLYGPTETTIQASYYTCRKGGEEGVVPIGRPIDNTRIYILNPNLQPLPVGVPGELHIGGVCLARGYLNQPELTAEKFIPHPFDDRPQARLYKTGDLARFLPDGNIEFLGRMDRQIKVRGCRVEPGEVEWAINQHQAIRQSVVKLWTSPSGEQALAAYLVLQSGRKLSLRELRRFLSPIIPDYMIPSVIVPLRELPYTPSGKVDMGALPEPERDRFTLEPSLRTPRTDLECRMVDIWERTLAVKPIGLGDNFFDLGGHSLLAVRLLALMEKEIGIRLPVSALFQAQTIEQLAEVMSTNRYMPIKSSLVRIKRGTFWPPLFLVHAHDGEITAYYGLARKLGQEQPVYGFRAAWNHDNQPRYTRVEDMAAVYVDDLLTLQPEGPCFLGGYCFGAHIAFEMARQLKIRGREVAFLALLDSYAPEFIRPLPGTSGSRGQLHYMIDLVRRFGAFLTYVSQLRPSQRLPYMMTLTKFHLSEMLQGFYLARGRSLPAFVQPVLCLRRKVLIDYLENYHPQVYHGSAVLFRPTKQPLGYRRDPLMGWGSLVAGGLKVEEVPGYHRTLLFGAGIRLLADRIRTYLP